MLAPRLEVRHRSVNPPQHKCEHAAGQQNDNQVHQDRPITQFYDVHERVGVGFDDGTSNQRDKDPRDRQDETGRDRFQRDPTPRPDDQPCENERKWCQYVIARVTDCGRPLGVHEIGESEVINQASY